MFTCVYWQLLKIERHTDRRKAGRNETRAKRKKRGMERRRTVAIIERDKENEESIKRKDRRNVRKMKTRKKTMKKEDKMQ